jgi:purine catabolism regulator
VIRAEPADEELERALGARAKRALLDRREQTLRAVVRMPPSGAGRLLDDLRAIRGDATAIGVSTVRVGAAQLADGFEEARQALLGASALARGPTVMRYDELGPYRYLLRLALDPTVQDATIDAVTRLAAYDRDRGASLAATLDEFLGRRGSISATSDALYVHPNTLRQRLRRIGEVAGIDLRRDEWLTIEIAVKIVRLRSALGTATADT